MDKFAFHLPLYRQHQRLVDAGIDVSRAWLTQVMQASASLLEPIHAAQLESIRASRVKSMDETPIKAEPGSCHVNPGSGQERKFGSDGKPEWDIDWDHDHGQGVPHGRNWERGPRGQPVRGPGVPISPWPQGRGRGQ